MLAGKAIVLKFGGISTKPTIRTTCASNRNTSTVISRPKQFHTKILLQNSLLTQNIHKTVPYSLFFNKISWSSNFFSTTKAWAPRDRKAQMEAAQQHQQPVQPEPIEQPHASEHQIAELNYTNFDALVVKSKVPVIMQCYADWSEPSAQLLPKLASLVAQAKGAVKLTRLNIDLFPDIAQQLKIEQLPTVFAFFQGRAVDGFIGMRKDEQLKEFVNGLMKLGGVQNAAKYLEQADKLLKEKNVEEASRLYHELLQRTELKVEPLALAGLARCALAENNVETAEAIVKQMRQNYPKDLDHPEVKKALAAVEVASQHAPVGEAQQELINKVNQNPTDLQSRYDLAMSFFAANRFEKALEQAFEIIKQNKKWNDEAARKLVLKIFDVLGPTDPLVKEGRRKLSNLWFLG